MKSLLSYLKCPIEIGDIYLAPISKTKHVITKIISYDIDTKTTIVKCTKLPTGWSTYKIGPFNIEYLVKK